MTTTNPPIGYFPPSYILHFNPHPLFVDLGACGTYFIPGTNGRMLTVIREYRIAWDDERLCSFLPREIAEMAAVSYPELVKVCQPGVEVKL